MSAPFIHLRGQRSNMVHRSTPIAAGFEDCLQTFYQLVSAMEADRETESPRWKPAQVVALKDEFSRLRAWGYDTGASSRSLDHALRKASGLQQQVSDLLNELGENTQKALDIVKNAAVLFSPPITLLDGVEYFNMVPRQGQATSQNDRLPMDFSLEIRLATVDVSNSLDCLCDLVPALRDPVPQDTFHRDASPSEARKDITLAEHMFPKASKTLLERLGHANWKRRQYQRELRKKRTVETSTEAKAARSTTHTAKVDVGGLGFRPVQADTKLTSADFNQLRLPDLGTRNHRSEFMHKTSSETGMLSNSETVFSGDSYFERISMTSIAESDEVTKWHQRVVPKPPMTLELGKTFVCHYCLHEILVGDDIATMDDWKDHVFLDLEPYLCTADENCSRADKTYAVKGEWFSHELTHRIVKVWFCQSCRLEFDDSDKFELHLKDGHDNTLKPEQLKMMLEMFERYTQKPLVDEPCSLCGHHCSDAKTLKEHTAAHLEQLALSSIDSDDDIEGELSENKPSPRTIGYFRSVETEAKKEQLHLFLVEQQQNRFAMADNDGNGTGKNISTDSDPGFLGDSDDETPAKPIIEALEKAPASSRPKRPVMKRHGETFLSKVEDFLEKQAPLDFENISALGTPAEVLQDPMSTNFQALTSQASRAVRTMPPPRNEGFVGRQSDLAKLYKELSVPGRTCILSGAGGMGKSATAIEYTYQFEETYAYIFWVLAETPVGCADSYSKIATHLVKDNDDVQDQDRLVMLSREFLEQTDKRWLVVFDNVDQLVDLQQYMPRNLLDTKGSVLVTTRKIDLGKLIAPPSYARIDLTSLNLDDSRRLLLSSAGTDFGDIKKHPEYIVAGQIATFAEQLPLALSSIAGFVEVSGCSLADFVELWKESQRHTAFHQSAKDILSSPTDRALEIVWNIGLREVTIDARELLNILAFLDSDTIQKDLLVGEHTESSLQILHSSEAFRYKRMTSELSRRRLIAIRQRDGQEILSIHRSLQAKILQDLEKDPRQRERVFSQAFMLVRKCFPLPSPIQVPTPDAWPACIKYLRHVLSLRKVTVGKLITVVPSVDLARLLSDGGINLWERGMTSEGLQLLRSAEDILHRLSLGSTEDMLKANIHVIVALLLQDYGLSSISESKDRIWQALQIRKDFQNRTPPEKYTKNDDILLHNAWSDYGCVLLQYNKYKDAEPIFRHCLTKYREWGVDESIPYEHAKYNHHMAFCKMYTRDFEEAIEMGERSVKFVILATGERSASTNNWKFHLACIVLQSGDMNKALSIHQEVLDARILQHGKSSFLTLQSYYAVGALYAYLGNLSKAESHMRDALALESSRRDSYPEAAIARTEFHLSHILRERGGSLEEADTLATSARVVLERLLPLSPLEVPEEHELALFDHLQPVFDGRFTGRHLLGYVS